VIDSEIARHERDRDRVDAPAAEFHTAHPRRRPAEFGGQFGSPHSGAFPCMAQRHADFAGAGGRVVIVMSPNVPFFVAERKDC
jgi:hypothetical protein